jgi:hypothetical protein
MTEGKMVEVIPKVRSLSLEAVRLGSSIWSLVVTSSLQCVKTEVEIVLAIANICDLVCFWLDEAEEAKEFYVAR